MLNKNFFILKELLSEPKTETHPITREHIVLKCSSKIFSELEELSLSVNSQISQVVLTVFQILLHRYSDLGVIVTGYTDTFVENKFLQDTVFSNVLQQVTADLKLLGKRKEKNVFKVCFVEGAIDELTMTSSRKFTLVFDEKSSEIAISYDPELFEEVFVRQFLSSMSVLLQSVIADPDQPIEKLAILTTEELGRQLIEWNQTEHDFPRDKTLVQLFEEQVEKTPNIIALRLGTEALTYRTLNERTNRLAHVLRDLYVIEGGIKPDTLIGLCIERGVNMIVAMMGVLKAGGAYVPIDTEYPEERSRFMLEDCKPHYILTQEHLRSERGYLSEDGRIVICLDSEKYQAEANDSLTCDPAQVNQPTDLALVIYTSGTTGRPKGVMVPHQGIVNLALFEKGYHNVTEKAHVSQFVSYNFVASNKEIYTTLLSGATLYIVPSNVRTDPSAFAKFLAENEISLAYIPPALLVHMPKVDLPLLGTILSGGEVGSQAAMEHWSHGRRFINSYGSSEITATATESSPFAIGESATKLGRPIHNAKVYVLDEYLQPRPSGANGELYVGGAGVTRGYLGLDSLNAERYIQNPFNKSDPSDRIFRTGDLVWYDTEGYLHFAGRVDHQIKLRGYRIELQEIEHHIESYPDIRRCVIIVRKDRTGRPESLVTFSETSLSEGDLEARLKRFLERQLPSQMIPSTFIKRESLPRTLGGKTDRKVLEDYVNSKEFTVSLHKDIQPITSMEVKVTGIVEELLGHDVGTIGSTANIQSLGLNSLTSTMLIRKLQKEFNVDISPGEISTIHDLAQKIEQFQQGHKAEVTKDETMIIKFSKDKQVVDERNPCIVNYRVLRVEDIEIATKLISETFLDPVRGEPMSQVLEISLKEMTNFLRPFCKIAAEQSLSTIASNNKTGEMIGAHICFAHATPDPEIDEALLGKFMPILAILEGVDKEVPPSVMKEGSPFVHKFIMGVRVEAPSNVAYMLRKMADELAKEKGFKSTITEPTGPISQRMIVAAGYQLHTPIPYDEFELEGKRVFQNIGKTYRERFSINSILSEGLNFSACVAATRPLSPPLSEKFRMFGSLKTARKGKSDGNDNHVEIERTPTAVLFQLDLIRKANYLAFKARVLTLFGTNADGFVQNSLPTVNLYKQDQITQDELFRKFGEIAKQYDVHLDSDAVKAMWSTLHPEPRPLVADIKSAIEFSRTGNKVVILAYSSRFAIDDLQRVLRKSEVPFVETKFGVCIADVVDVYCSFQYPNCSSPEQFYKKGFQCIQKWKEQQTGEARGVYLQMDVNHVPMPHRRDLQSKDDCCFKLCNRFKFEIEKHEYKSGELAILFLSLDSEPPRYDM